MSTENQNGADTKAAAESKDAAKAEVKAADVKKEYVEVEYLKDVLPYKKGDKRILHSTTAEAIKKHKQVKITKRDLTIDDYKDLKTKKSKGKS